MSEATWRHRWKRMANERRKTTMNYEEDGECNMLRRGKHLLPPLKKKNNWFNDSDDASLDLLWIRSHHRGTKLMVSLNLSNSSSHCPHELWSKKNGTERK
ncbi:ABC transporter G family member 20-like [Sarcoptes scabiei]|nr:ABC transporter G family member 20-like [Sarcoptes scabiei]